MDYFINGRMEITDADTVNLLVEAQKQINTVTFKTGEAQRTAHGSDLPDLFSFQARTQAGADARKVYNTFKELMETHNIPGWMGWHECRHDEGESGCTWNEEFYWPGGV